MPIAIQCLGQSGLRLELEGVVVFVDPYLSDRVAELYGDELRRLRPAPLRPETIGDAEHVLITHAHEDHCDPATLVPLATASPRARFLGPAEAIELLEREGIAAGRLEIAEERWYELGPGVDVHPVPAAHPELERDGRGRSRFLGYVLRSRGHRLYHSGDTSAHAGVIAAARALGPIDTAFLPVNERNFYRERRGIIGNMSVREAFGMAEELGVRTLVPIHWDLFAPNSVFREEIELLYKRLRPPFRLRLEPSEI